MTPEAQRIAIAEACGWPQPSHCEGVIWMPHPNGRNTSYGLMVEVDPLNDLNAMHEAEKVFNVNQMATYLNFVWPKGTVASQAIRATAAQRAEAFLKTLNLWNE